MGEQTLGEQRVGINLEIKFKDVETDKIMKQETAKIIDILEAAKKRIIEDIPDSEKRELGEFVRLVSLAQTAYEEASMWVAKALTKF